MLNVWLEEIRAKPRLRLGLLAALVLGWIFALLELEAAGDAARLEETRLANEIGRMQAISGETHWWRQRDEVFVVLADLRRRAWREESEGRMQALMQDWVRDQLARHGLQATELNVVVLPAVELNRGDSRAGGSPGAARTSGEPVVAGQAGTASIDSDLRLVRSRVVFDFQSDSLHQLLGAIAASPNWLWVPRLVVRNSGRRSVEMELEALFILGSRGGA